ncbi:MAG: hypothetical protein M1819_007097 [Sarea resinae]|nr:MAG: hypothetical protein M1819_007097 [Sarea resinae]
MSTRRPKTRPNQTMISQPSDYESDANNISNLSDMPPPPPPRSNAELNLSVIRRHNPAVTSILSIAHYSVVYIFSLQNHQWEKSGVEGTLFVCQLTASDVGAERFGVMVLNRRGLNNFYTELLEGEDVEITEEYVILRVSSDDAESGQQVYGLWIFSEPPPSSTANTRAINAQIIQDCAVQAETSRRLAIQKQNTAVEQESRVEEPQLAESVPMGRQLSLRELFGQQREQDDGWSVKVHSPPKSSAQFMPSADTNFFLSSKPAKLQQSQSVPEPGRDILGDLFRKAGESYQGS